MQSLTYHDPIMYGRQTSEYAGDAFAGKPKAAAQQPQFSTSAWRLYAWRNRGGDLPVSGRTDAFHQEVNHLLQCLLQRQPATGSILVDQLI